MSETQLVDELVPTGTPLGQDRTARLHQRLVTEAERAGLLDLSYRVVDSPVGSLLLAATPGGLVRVAFDGEGHEAVLTQLAHHISPRILRSAVRLDPAARQLDEYFARRRRRFEVPLDLRLARGFRQTVLEHLGDITYGTTATYASVASASGNPKAVRAVGSACAQNPVPVLVPCHRVVRSDGNPGGYRGGPAAKQTLLTLEAD